METPSVTVEVVSPEPEAESTDTASLVSIAQTVGQIQGALESITQRQAAFEESQTALWSQAQQAQETASAALGTAVAAAVEVEQVTEEVELVLAETELQGSDSVTPLVVEETSSTEPAKDSEKSPKRPMTSIWDHL